jgi:hypothetical protein
MNELWVAQQSHGACYYYEVRTQYQSNWYFLLHLRGSVAFPLLRLPAPRNSYLSTM